MRYVYDSLSYYHCDKCHRTVFVEDLPDGHPDKLFAHLEEQKRNEGEGEKKKLIYTDNVHLMGDDPRELHIFARSVGLKRQWFQEHPHHPHYDITTSRMLRRILSRDTVVRISTKELLEKIIRQGAGDSQLQKEVE